MLAPSSPLSPSARASTPSPLTQVPPAPSDFQKLHAFLRTNFENDVLIPCPVSEKRPLFSYAKQSWNWESFDKYFVDDKVEAGETDWAVILNRICVVDVDDPSTAAALEGQYPVLRQAPCQRTKRGFHYFFKRSSAADAQGLGSIFLG